MVLIILGAAAAVFAGDFVVFRMRGMPAGTYDVQQLLAIPQKNGKLEYMRGDVVPTTCAHALLPQQGNPPCWWLAKHTKRQINY